MTNVANEIRGYAAWWLAGVVALCSCVGLMAWYWSGGLPYDTSSGVWTALADDVAHGELYRAVEGPTGFGGTRYMPLFFSMHGALIHAGWSAAGAGLALTLASFALILGATYTLARTLGASRSVALPGTLLMTASIAFQLLSLSIKGDLLGAALNTAGLALALTGAKKNSPGGLRGAGVLLGLAILCKFTEVFAIATLGLWFARERKLKRLVELGLPMIAVVVAGVALAQWLSGGRMADAFAVCATGGLSPSYAWRFPFWFARVAIEDPFFVALFLGGVMSAWLRWRRNGIDFAVLYFAVSAAGTVLIFVSPGTDSNHLMDALVAAVVLMVLEVSEGHTSAVFVRRAGWCMALAIAATWIPGAPSVRNFFQARGRPTLAAIDEIARRLPVGAAEELLAENPIVPIALGQRPRVLDCFSLRLLASRSPEVRRKFFEKLESRRYSAVVLVDWSGVAMKDRLREMEAHTSLGAEHFYGEVHFPAGFLETLKRNYRLSFVVSPFVVFEPMPADMLRKSLLQ